MLQRWVLAALPGDLWERQKDMGTVTVVGSGRMLHARCQVGRLQPVDVGPLRRSRELEAALLPMMGLHVGDAHPGYDWDTAPKILP